MTFAGLSGSYLRKSKGRDGEKQVQTWKNVRGSGGEGETVRVSKRERGESLGIREKKEIERVGFQTKRGNRRGNWSWKYLKERGRYVSK